MHLNPMFSATLAAMIFWIGEGLKPHGEPKDSEGSDYLVEVFEKDDDRPIFVQAWGGTITFVQALHRFREKHGEEKFEELLAKIHLFGILFQDISFEYFASFEDMQNETCAGFGTAIPTYGEEPVELGMALHDNGHFWYYVWSNDPDYQRPVTSQMVNGHGPMSDIYDDGGEGDTPSYLYLLSSIFGLNDHLDSTHGSWGSMFRPMGGSFSENYYTTCDISQDELIRWVPAATNSFMNRLQWSVKDPGEVNQKPVAVVNGDPSNRIIQLKANPGEVITLDASGSYDPEGDEITFYWFRYIEADSYTGEVEISDRENAIQQIMTFDYESLRFIQFHIHGQPGQVTISNVGVRRRMSGWDSLPTVETSDEKVNRVLTATINTLYNSAQDLMVDCMGRERQQYSGDVGQ